MRRILVEQTRRKHSRKRGFFPEFAEPVGRRFTH
jgi:hypothetical protein